MKLALMTLAALGLAAAGCQQKMADQPAHRPYETSDLFPNKQSARPIERGTVHRNQPIDGDPLTTWLTEKGKTPAPAFTAEQLSKYAPSVAEELKSVQADVGAPTDPANFVDKLPFAVTREDYAVGQKLYTNNCALCHGAAGHGNGKIPERGFLRPPSYHQDPAGKAKDWSSRKPNQSTGVAEPDYTTLARGYSRGFSRLGKEVPLDKVPVGYIFQVITWGYGGMASHVTQIPDPADRWKVVAYVKALQLSQGAKKGDLPTDVQQLIDHPPAKNIAPSPEVKH